MKSITNHTAHSFFINFVPADTKTRFKLKLKSSNFLIQTYIYTHTQSKYKKQSVKLENFKKYWLTLEMSDDVVEVVGDLGGCM